MKIKSKMCSNRHYDGVCRINNKYCDYKKEQNNCPNLKLSEMRT